MVVSSETLVLLVKWYPLPLLSKPTFVLSSNLYQAVGLIKLSSFPNNCNSLKFNI